MAGNKPQIIIKQIQNTVRMYISRKHYAFPNGDVLPKEAHPKCPDDLIKPRT